MYVANFIDTTIMLCLCVAYSISVRDVLNPVMLFNVSVGISYLVYYFVFKSAYPISKITLTAFLVGQLAFNLSYYFGGIFFTSNEIESVGSVRINSSGFFVRFALAVGLVGYIQTFMYFRRLGGAISNVNGISSVRDAYVTADSVPFLITYGKYALIFATMVLFFDFMKSQNRNKVRRIIIFFLIALCASISLITQSRTDLVIGVLPFVVIYFRLDKSKHKLNKYFLVAVAGLVLIFFLSVLRNQNTDGIGFFSPENATMQYMGLPLVAFSQWISLVPGSSNGFYSIEPLEKVMGIFGNAYTGDGFAKFGQFNVYSYLQNPYLDFGMVGVLIWMLLIGLFCRWLYAKSRSGKRFYLLFYALYSYSLVMAFFSWQFTITTYVYFLIFWVVLLGSETLSARMNRPGNEENKKRVYYR